MVKPVSLDLLRGDGVVAYNQFDGNVSIIRSSVGDFVCFKMFFLE